jgi:hypothetical protein
MASLITPFWRRYLVRWCERLVKGRFPPDLFVVVLGANSHRAHRVRTRLSYFPCGAASRFCRSLRHRYCSHCPPARARILSAAASLSHERLQKVRPARFMKPRKPSNQSMKPTAPLRYKFSVFATTPRRRLTLYR